MFKMTSKALSAKGECARIGHTPESIREKVAGRQLDRILRNIKAYFCPLQAFFGQIMQMRPFPATDIQNRRRLRLVDMGIYAIQQWEKETGVRQIFPARQHFLAVIVLAAPSSANAGSPFWKHQSDVHSRK